MVASVVTATGCFPWTRTIFLEPSRAECPLYNFAVKGAPEAPLVDELNPIRFWTWAVQYGQRRTLQTKRPVRSFTDSIQDHLTWCHFLSDSRGTVDPARLVPIKTRIWSALICFFSIYIGTSHLTRDDLEDEDKAIYDIMLTFRPPQS